MMTFDVIQIMQGVDGSELAFNYFFSIMIYFGLFAFGLGLMVKIINRS